MPYNSLRPIREKKGITVAQLAGKTSISIRTLQSYESGDRTIAPDDLRKLSRVLYVSSSDILQPSAPPPPPPDPPAPIPAKPVQSEAPKPSVSIPAKNPAPVAPPVRRPPISSVREEVRRPPSNGPSARPPRESRQPKPPGPATAGQIDQIRNLARRMGLDEAALADRLGAPIGSLDHMGARAAIARLRAEMEESGTWQPRVAEGPDREGEYLAKLREQGVPIEIQLISGDRFQGTIDDFTPYVIRLRDSQSGNDVTLRKLAIAFYQTQASVDGDE